MINSARAIVACAEFKDSDGVLDNGIMAIGWNNKPFYWNEGQMGVYFDWCNSNPQSPLGH